jgi:hypothetical protein
MDLLLIASYGWFFRECFRWSNRCLGFSLGRRFTRTFGKWIVLGSMGTDLLENLLLSVGHVALSRDLWGWVRVVSVVKWFFLSCALLIVIIVLLTGARRFVLPWTIPPATPADLPPRGTPLNPVPAVTARSDRRRWFVDATGKEYQSVEYGVGMSGGGIRSAAFCSGVLQALAGTPLSLSKADYLATVSGGGYVGISSQIIRHELGSGAPTPDPYAEDAPETEFLQCHHRYLGDDSLARVQVLIAIVIGWISNAFLIGGPLLLLGFALALVPGFMPGDRDGTTTGSVLIVAVVVALMAFVLWQRGTAEYDVETTPPDEQLHGQKRRRTWLRRVSTVLMVLGCGGVLYGVPWSWWWIVATFVLAGLGSLIWYISVASGHGPRWLPSLAIILFNSAWISLALGLVSLTADGVPGNPTSWGALNHQPIWGWTAGAVFALLVAGFLLADQTWWSPHLFYKARLASTFAIRRISEKEAGQISFDRYTYLTEWAQRAPSGPELLVCATANTEDLSVPPAGTRAVPFVFAHDYVGSPELGWWSTANFRRCLGRSFARDGTLQAAMAISGAAVASAVGAHGRKSSVGRLLALLNARLGVWLPNPRSMVAWPEPDEGWNAVWRRRRGPSWLWREVIGILPVAKRFVYVSDGGHLDNLGLLELLRRRCRLILIIDASADKVGTSRTLDGVLKLATSHLDVRFDRDASPALKTPVEPGTTLGDYTCLRGLTIDCVETITIRYPFKEDENGKLVVAKARFAPTLEGNPHAMRVIRAIANERGINWPWSLRTMPKTMTANQSLTDNLFNNYVLLGRAVGERTKEVLGVSDPKHNLTSPQPQIHLRSDVKPESVSSGRHES